MTLKIAPHRPTPAQRGFTIIELMIAVLVVGVLLAIALPSFMDSIRKGRRAEAFAALAQVQQAQERWRANNASYVSVLGNTAEEGSPPTGLQLASGTPGGYYGVSIVGGSASATGYQAVAVGVAGTSQAKDEQCRRLAVEMDGGNLRYAGCGPAADCALVFSATHACWAR